MPFDPKKTRQAIRDLGKRIPGPTEQDNLHLSVPMSHEGVHSLLTTKGDLAAFSTKQVRLAVGGNRLPLLADSGAAEGLAWAGSTWLPNPHRKFLSGEPEYGGTTWIEVGNTAAGPAFSGTASNAEDATGDYLNYASAALADSDAGALLQSVVCPATRTKPVYVFSMKTGSATDIDANSRLWVGAFSDAPSAFMASNTPALSYFAFRYSPAADGTAFWRTVTDSGSGTPTVTVTTAAIAADTRYVLMVDCTDSASLKFIVDGVLVATHTATLPSTTQKYTSAIMTRTLDATARNVKTGKIYITWD